MTIIICKTTEHKKLKHIVDGLIILRCFMPCDKNLRCPKTKTEISASKIKIKNNVLGKNRDLLFNIKFIEKKIEILILNLI